MSEPPSAARDTGPPRPGTIFVIGAGLAGLSAALRLAKAGATVRVFEAAGHAGGRCRSFFDTQLGVEIDNGNHLLLGGNISAMRYLRDIAAEDTLLRPATAAIPFVDLAGNRHWTIRPNAGRFPTWIFAAGRRVPGSGPADYLAALRLAFAGADATIDNVFGRTGAAYRGFWEPLAVAVLNTAAREASARLLWPVMTEILAKGEAAARPVVAGHGLSKSFVDRFAAAAGERVTLRFNDRLRAVVRDGARIAKLVFASGEFALAAADRVVLAVPPQIAGDLLPGLTVPDEFRPIVNVHFVLDRPVALPGMSAVLGLVGGTAQWLFKRGTVLSVTISAAEREVEFDDERLIAAVWADIEKALALAPGAPPRFRIVREKRATIAQTPTQVRKRPRAGAAGLGNLALAGDWTDTGLPATIEGAIRSGEIAAKLVLG